MDLINDIRFDLARAYFNEENDSVPHRRIDRDNARSLIERLEQVYAQITSFHERSKGGVAPASNNEPANSSSH